jgi:phytoene synthase
MNDKALELTDVLNPVERLALAYAPRRARAAWTGLLAFEHRLADAAREGREPIMIQLRLAWWRDRMGEPAAQWPEGEPLLGLLRPWDAERAALRGLVDGWEARIVGEDGGAELENARVAAMVALARLLGVRDGGAVDQAARDWRWPELAGAAPRLPQTMRPLTVLRGMAVRAARHGDDAPGRAFLAAVRLGLLGR